MSSAIAEEPFITVVSPASQIRHVPRKPIEDRSHDKDGDEDDKCESGLVILRHWLWYFGHVYITIASAISILTFPTFLMRRLWAKLLYKSVFSAVSVTYGISLWQALGGSKPGFFSLLPLETFQYMMLSLVWILTPPHVLKLVPFLLYSSLHSLEFIDERHPDSKLGHKSFLRFSDQFAPKILRLIGYFDIIIIVQLIIDCLLIRRGAVVSLVTYAFFYHLRLMYTPSTAQVFQEVFDKVDKELSKESRPPKVRKVWIRLRNRVESDRLKTSKLHTKDTDEAIETANAIGDLK